MNNEINKNKFKPRARLLVQLGDQLIRNENIAIVELVKNSYDADATTCEVIFNDIDSLDSGEIIVKDNGIGMTPEVVHKIWLEPGADFKELMLKGNQYVLGFNFTLPKRTPIGEKGVGRFGVHKLGDYIKLVTKSPDSDKEVVVEIDWNEFSKSKYLDQATFPVVERTPELFTDGTNGTYILIKKIKKTWDENLYQDLQRTLLSLNSPFQKKNDFKVMPVLSLEDKNKQKFWEKSTLLLEQIREKALWKMDCTLEGDKITDFHFEFTPWPELDKLSPRVLNITDLPVREIRYKDKNKEVTINLNSHKIGLVRIQAYLFDLGTKILNYGVQDPIALKQYLAKNGGVKVYRDGFRVYDYGETDNDWLNLDRSRINEPVKKIGNRNILAAVQLNRKDSSDLLEKTNREGFIENPAYSDFQKAVSAVIDIFAQQRNIDKLQMQRFYEGTSKTQPVLHDIEEIKDLIDTKLIGLDMEDKEIFKSEIFSNLDRLRDRYVETNKILLKSAGAGLSLSVVIHEIEKRIKDVISILDAEVFDRNRLKIIIKSIAKLVDNYAILVSSEKTKNVSIVNIITDSLFNSEFRFKAHKIDIIKKFETSKDFKVDCSVNTIIGVLLNIFDNSIYWLNAYAIKNKKILIDTKIYTEDKASIIIADNGKGFTISPEDAIQPFITTRPGGIGLGLHIVSEMMKGHNGKLLIRDFKETSGIPEEYKNGSIIELVFKKK